MLNISGEKVKLWVNQVEGRNGTFETYTISVPRKVDGEYVYKSVKFVMGKDVNKPSHIGNGTFINFEGFPTLDIYTDRSGNERREIVVFATKVTFLDGNKTSNDDVDGFVQQEIDIPF